MKTKIVKGVLAACVAALAVFPLSAQDDSASRRYNDDKLRVVELGARFMPTVTTLTLNTANGQSVKGDATIGMGYGAFVAFNFSKNIGFQGEVNYIAASQKYKDRGLERTVDINYLNIPLLLSLNTNKMRPVNFNVVVGPQFGINVGSRLSTSGTPDNGSVNAVLAVKPGDVGVAYGAGFEFALNPAHTFRIDVGYRGMYGLVDIRAKNIGANEYNVLVKGSRRSDAAYIGLAVMF